MPATQVPPPVAADSTGLPDSFWIDTVRDSLEDFPRWLLEQYVHDVINGLPTISPVSCKKYMDLSIQISVNQSYNKLPASFNDSLTKIILFEVNDLNQPTAPYRVAPSGEERVGLGLLHLPWSQRYG